MKLFSSFIVLLAMYGSMAQAALVRVPWVDPKTHLMWTGKDNGVDVTQPQAVAYCRNLQLSGYSDWRLPTIDELAGIYDAQESQPDWQSGPSVKHHVKGGLQLSGFQWSNSSGSDSLLVWQLNFISGTRYDGLFKNDLKKRALCVRATEQLPAATTPSVSTISNTAIDSHEKVTETDDSKPNEIAELNRALLQDSSTWSSSRRLDVGSIRNASTERLITTGEPLDVAGEYTYNGGQKEMAVAVYWYGKLTCLQYMRDHKLTPCSPVGRPDVAYNAEELLAKQKQEARPPVQSQSQNAANPSSSWATSPSSASSDRGPDSVKNENGSSVVAQASKDQILPVMERDRFQLDVALQADSQSWDNMRYDIGSLHEVRGLYQSQYGILILMRATGKFTVNGGTPAAVTTTFTDHRATCLRFVEDLETPPDPYKCALIKYLRTFRTPQLQFRWVESASPEFGVFTEALQREAPRGLTLQNLSNAVKEVDPEGRLISLGGKYTWSDGSTGWARTDLSEGRAKCIAYYDIESRPANWCYVNGTMQKAYIATGNIDLPGRTKPPNMFEIYSEGEKDRVASECHRLNGKISSDGRCLDALDRPVYH